MLMRRSRGPYWDDDHCTTFMRFVKKGKLVEMRAELASHSEQEREVLTNASERGISVLMVAIRHEYPYVVRLLLENSANPTYMNPFTKRLCSPMVFAIEGESTLILKLVSQAYLAKKVKGEHGFISAQQLQADFEKQHQSKAVRMLIQLYADLDLREFLDGVAHDFRLEPAQTLQDLIQLAAYAKRFHMRLRDTEPSAAAQMTEASERMQLAAAGCCSALGPLKDGLGRFEVDELMRCAKGFAALKTAMQYNCRSFVAQPELQAFIGRTWRGPLLERLVNEQDYTSYLRGAPWVVLSLVLNLLLLPLAALLPSLETVVYEWLADTYQKARVERSTDAQFSRRRRSAQLTRSMLGRMARTRGLGGLTWRRTGASSPDRGSNGASGMSSVSVESSISAESSAESSASMPAEGGADGDDGATGRSYQTPAAFELYLMRVPAFKYGTRLVSTFGLATILSLYIDFRDNSPNGKLATLSMLLWAGASPPCFEHELPARLCTHV